MAAESASDGRGQSDGDWIDEGFLDLFDREWRRCLEPLGKETCVVLRRGDFLYRYFADEETVLEVVGADYGVLKRAAHLPLRAYLMRRSQSNGESPSIATGLRNALDDGDDWRAVQRIEQLTREFWRATRSGLQWPALERFTDSVYEPLQRVIRSAAAKEVEQLAQATAEFAKLTPEEAWRSAYFCVVGGTEPRYKELSKQYFAAYLDEIGSARGGTDHQLVYAEGDHDRDSVFELIAKREFNRRIAELFTGSATGLEEDVLGDAASRAIAQHFQNLPASPGARPAWGRQPGLDR